MIDNHNIVPADAFVDDVPAIAVAALAPVAMTDALRLRAVAVLAIVLAAEEEDARAMRLDDGEVIERCRAVAEGHAERVARDCGGIDG